MSKNAEFEIKIMNLEIKEQKLSRSFALHITFSLYIYSL